MILVRWHSTVTPMSSDWSEWTCWVTVSIPDGWLFILFGSAGQWWNVGFNVCAVILKIKKAWAFFFCIILGFGEPGCVEWGFYLFPCFLLNMFLGRAGWAIFFFPGRFIGFNFGNWAANLTTKLFYFARNRMLLKRVTRFRFMVGQM